MHNEFIQHLTKHTHLLYSLGPGLVILNKHIWILGLILSGLSLTSTSGYCEDNLPTVMARMRPNTAVTVGYKEKRQISMMSKTWQGSGNFYVLPPDGMIKEQQLPEKELMGIKGTLLYYFNQSNGQKHQGEMSDQDSLSVHTATFKSLIIGDLKYLSEFYNIELNKNPSGWMVTFTSKNTDPENTLRVIMQGLPDQPASQIELISADGDRTEYLLDIAKSGETVKLTINQLFALLGAN
jgi:hypothetical protein